MGNDLQILCVLKFVAAVCDSSPTTASSSKLASTTGEAFGSIKEPRWRAGENEYPSERPMWMFIVIPLAGGLFIFVVVLAILAILQKGRWVPVNTSCGGRGKWCKSKVFGYKNVEM